MCRLDEIAWNVSEEEYRASLSLNYSLLAKFERGGFDALATLKEGETSPSLTFGSLVDCLLTDPLSFDKRYIVYDFPKITDKVESTVKALFTVYGATYSKLTDIPLHNLLNVLDSEDFQKTYKNETRINNILLKGDEYYQILCRTVGKEVVCSEMYQKALNCANAVKEHPIAKKYFNNNPFETETNYYQLKFKTELNGVSYKCMVDVVHVDYDKKEITLVDLKTSSKPEWHFAKSFIQWNYEIQARLYYRIVQRTLSQNDFFKDFMIKSYKFVVVCPETLCPLVWDFEQTEMYGDLHFGDIVMKDPEDIAKLLLQYYADVERKTPYGVEVNEINSLTEKIEEYEIKNKSKM